MTVAPRKSMEPWLRDDVVFYDHQIKGVRKLMRMKSFLLADEMGLGKSLQALTVFVGDVVTGQGNTAIIVCPVTLRTNWADEIEKFTRVPFMLLGEEVNPKTGKIRTLTPGERTRQIVEFAHWNTPKILILNYEQVDPHLDELNALGFRVAIYDEAHSIKNPSAKRTKACLALKSERSFMLTGSPILNQVQELWAALNRIAPAHFPNYYAFRNRYCNTPDAPIWMADGSFKPIGDIKVGDKVMGWIRQDGKRRRLMSSTVEAVSTRIAPRVIEATMESGRKIKCTPDHVWLAGNHNGDRDYEWVRIKPENTINKGTLSRVVDTIKPIEDVNISHEAGWLGGIYDGEGSRNFIAQSRSHNPEICLRIADALDMLDIPYTMEPMGFRLRGGRETWTKMLHWCKVTKREWFESSLFTQLNRHKDTVIHTRELGSGEVVSMQTSTGNYIAWGYASKNCVFGGYKGKQVVGVKNQKELTRILEQVMLRRLKRDTLDLPDVQYIQVPVRLHPEQQKLYDRVEEEMQLDNVDPNGPPHEIDNAMTQMLRLKQICGTPATLGFADNSYKLDSVVEKAREVLNNGEKLIIFTQFRPVLACAAKRLRDEGLPVTELHGGIPKHDRQGIVRDWASYPQPNIIICMLQVAGVGLNMTAAKRLFFIDKLFVPLLNKQAVDRSHRIGQSTTQPVQVTEFIAVGTVERRIEQILRIKQKTFDNVIEGAGVVRQILQALREVA